MKQSNKRLSSKIDIPCPVTLNTTGLRIKGKSSVSTSSVKSEKWKNSVLRTHEPGMPPLQQVLNEVVLKKQFI